MEDGVGDMAYVNVMRLLDDCDGIQSSWASISVRMLSGLAALWGQKVGNSRHLDDEDGLR